MNKKKAMPVALHTLEIAAVIALVWVLSNAFPDSLPKDAVSDVLVLAIAAAVKYARVSPDFPVSDYVNGQKPR